MNIYNSGKAISGEAKSIIDLSWGRTHRRGDVVKCGQAMNAVRAAYVTTSPCRLWITCECSVPDECLDLFPPLIPV